MINKSDYISRVPYNQEMIIEYKEQITDRGIIVRNPYIADRNFVMQSINLAYIIPKLSKPAICLIQYIYIKLISDTNTICIERNAFLEFANLKRAVYFKAVNELINNDIIYKGDCPGKFIINIKYIFKGSIFNYLKIYNDKYGKMDCEND